MDSEQVGLTPRHRYPLQRLFAEIKSDVRADDLRDEEIDAELRRHRAERRR